MSAPRNWGPGHPSYPRASMITPDPRPECAQLWCREPVAGGGAHCRHHQRGAPTLPTRAERDPLRKVAGYAVKDGSTILLDEPGAVLRRLLDWADAQEAAAEHPSLARHVETLRELAAVHDDPRYVTCGDAVAIRAVLAALEAEAVLAGGQAPERGPRKCDSYVRGVLGCPSLWCELKSGHNGDHASGNSLWNDPAAPVRQPDDGGAK